MPEEEAGGAVSVEALALKLQGGVGEEADLKRPETEEDFRLDEVLLLAELVLKRLIITIDYEAHVKIQKGQ